ncbi:hypothetical protein V9N49_003660 [Vibrio cholerae]|nr:hypothetical protein [Vibrio cholerae]EIJ0936096.1 hypothetical protein [Vibrio cholerae]
MDIGSEMLPDNPAARLQSLLRNMLKTKYESSEQIAVVFARMLEVENQPSEIFPHYSQLFTLIEDAYNKVMQYYPRQEKTHSVWRVYFTDIFQKYSPYHHQWVALLNAIQQGNHLDMIQIANDNLEHYVLPTQVNGLTIDELEEQVSKLIADIMDSDDLSDYLKIYLTEELKRMLVYIKHFDLYGSEPIKKSIYNIIANTEVSKNIKSKAITGVSALLITVASAIGVINDVASIQGSIEYLKTQFNLLSDDSANHSSTQNSSEPELLLRAEKK